VAVVGSEERLEAALAPVQQQAPFVGEEDPVATRPEDDRGAGDQDERGEDRGEAGVEEALRRAAARAGGGAVVGHAPTLARGVLRCATVVAPSASG
jgi:hypothetical protein